MATANGADFSTQCYRHGVLIGNWSEDQYGCDLMASTALGTTAAYAQFASNQTGGAAAGGALLFGQPLSTTHTSFTTAGHDVVRASVHDEKVQARMSSEVSAGLLFPHKGSDTIDRRYLTSYAQSFTAGTGRVQDPPLSRTLQKLRENRAEPGQESEGARAQSRSRSYRTASSDAFNASSSVMALPVEQSRPARPHVAHPERHGQLSRSLEANYRNLALRKD